MEAYTEFYHEAQTGGRVYTFRVNGRILSDELGVGGFVKSFLFWSSSERALKHQQQTDALGGVKVVEIPLEEFCTETLTSLTEPEDMAMVFVSLNYDKARTAQFDRGVDSVREYLDHFRLNKSGDPPHPGFLGERRS